MMQTAHISRDPLKTSTEGSVDMLSETGITSDSHWKRTGPVGLTRESFLDLLFGRTPLVREEQFLTPSQSQGLYDHFVPLLSPYLHVTGPPVSKVGVAQFEFQAQSAEDFKNRAGDEKERYFRECEKVRTLHDGLADIAGENVWEKMSNIVAELVPEYDVCVANEGPGKTYFSGIVRKINSGVPVHCDWAPYDCATEDWILSKITHQLAVNLYLSPATRGGSTTVFDVQWTPGALEYRDPATYGYFEDLVRGRATATFQPGMGDLCFFNSRNLHIVRSLEPGEDTQRIAMSSFVGLLPTEVTGGKPKLIFWS
ncbi:putative Prolyl 4-hydroxylase alpha subunit Fe(2+) 2OG dioxygenase domain-containing protein [Seiridium unicorne]|uniref:Prolyl 4-hydroxylase alpha subunit Fe(2+) 2OG dioxygenase domain-containing protein n=1 Tax=Seiridium unicorne TaxID=138068 RepID=A0ABR2V1U0_9PEZI